MSTSVGTDGEKGSVLCNAPPRDLKEFFKECRSGKRSKSLVRLTKRWPTIVFCHDPGNDKGNTGFLVTCSADSRVDAMSHLLTLDTDVGARRAADGATCLHLACEEGAVKVVKYLLAHCQDMPKFDVNARDNEGNTPLHVASARGHLEICKLLTGAHADLHAETDRQCTALDLALDPKVASVIQGAIIETLKNETAGISKLVDPAKRPPLPPTSWQTHTNVDGRQFYYNSSSGKSVWEKPDELMVYEAALKLREEDGKRWAEKQAKSVLSRQLSETRDDSHSELSQAGSSSSSVQNQSSWLESKSDTRAVPAPIPVPAGSQAPTSEGQTSSTRGRRSSDPEITDNAPLRTRPRRGTVAAQSSLREQDHLSRLSALQIADTEAQLARWDDLLKSSMEEKEALDREVNEIRGVVDECTRAIEAAKATAERLNREADEQEMTLKKIEEDSQGMRDAATKKVRELREERQSLVETLADLSSQQRTESIMGSITEKEKALLDGFTSGLIQPLLGMSGSKLEKLEKAQEEFLSLNENVNALTESIDEAKCLILRIENLALIRSLASRVEKSSDSFQKTIAGQLKDLESSEILQRMDQHWRATLTRSNWASHFLKERRKLRESTGIKYNPSEEDDEIKKVEDELAKAKRFCEQQDEAGLQQSLRALDDYRKKFLGIQNLRHLLIQ